MAAAGSPVEELCDEMTCPICLEYFKDPVTIDCGHNFCRACLTQCWGESDTDPSCPQCREIVQQRNFRPNRVVANAVALVKKLQEGTKTEGKRGECRKHQEPLKLFCKSDEALICVVCDRSKGHRGHNVVPVEEAVEEYKVKIQAQLQTLEKARERLVDQKLDEKQTSQKCLAMLGAEKQKIRSAFELMEKFLQENKSIWLTHLEDLEKETEKRWRENATKLSEEISSSTALISEMEETCQKPANELLQDIRSTLARYQKVQMRQLLKTGPDLEERIRSYSLKCSALKGTMKKCQESLEQILNPLRKVNVTLDPKTANPWLTLSEDRKSVTRELSWQNLPNYGERFDRKSCVLGHERFASGRHWWEVEVVVEVEDEQWTWWAVGVARESVRRKGDIRFDPKEGIWAVGKNLGSVLAFTTPECTPLPLRHDPRKIQVFLDYEKGRVEIFDAETEDSIFTFHSVSFSGEKIQPFFWVGVGITLNC